MQLWPNGREIVPLYAFVSSLTSEKGTFSFIFLCFIWLFTHLFVSLRSKYARISTNEQDIQVVSSYVPVADDGFVW